VSREKAKEAEIARENTIINETLEEIEKLKADQKSLEERMSGKNMSEAETKLKLVMAQQIMLEKLSATNRFK